MKGKYFRNQNQVYYAILNRKTVIKVWGQVAVINNLHRDKLCNLLFKTLSLLTYLVNHKTSYLCFYALKRTQLLFVEGNEMHLKESKWTLRCGNRVSAYFLNHNCLAFWGKVSLICILLWWLHFWKDGDGQRATTQAENLKWQLCTKGLFAMLIRCGKKYTIIQVLNQWCC